ncbi:hypothetical protein BDY19DRAFT_902371 [Irpex rosettiformis]|uniref:Uncharacterized protein n=1 Tax=Irpex rosettiformis TaxID=378272 RepID=A0ACB8UH80_9APHY|nr:hypothetical protein BDY19DRAFT_902371 [Irpex rosettiformis]
MKFTLSYLLVITAAIQQATASYCCQQTSGHQLCPLPPPTDLNRRLSIAGRVAPFVEGRSAQACCCAAPTADACVDICDMPTALFVAGSLRVELWVACHSRSHYRDLNGIAHEFSPRLGAQ